MEHSVVFIPWFESESPCGELDLQAQQWHRESTEKVYTVTYVGDEFPLYIPKKAESIYIMGGHCEPKLDNVYWSPKGGKKQQLYPREYALRFNMLFPTSIECRVLVYSCYSAAGGDDAFGRRVAAELRKLGYKQCQLWGYTEAVAQQYYGGAKGAGGVKSPVVKKTFPPDINDEHPHRYAKKGHFGVWKRVSESLERLDLLP